MVAVGWARSLRREAMRVEGFEVRSFLVCVVSEVEVVSSEGMVVLAREPLGGFLP